MAEIAPVTSYAPRKKKKKKPVRTAMSGFKKKNKTGGTKHVVASTGGSL